MDRERRKIYSIMENRQLIRSESISSLASKASESSLSTSYHPSAKSTYLVPIFWFISFGYMLPWTALGSLISYYKTKYSAHFYVEIYCAYYLLGLPVAIIQFRYSEMIDQYFGSQKTFFVRGVTGYLLQVCIMFALMYVANKTCIIVLFAMLGAVSWWLHGSATMMTSLFPKLMIASLQIGFRSPEIFTVIADSVWSLGSDATTAHIHLLLKTIMVITLLSLACWSVITSSASAGRHFDNRDERMRVEGQGHVYSRINNNDDEASNLMQDHEDTQAAEENEWRAVVPSRSSSESPSESPSPRTSLAGTFDAQRAPSRTTSFNSTTSNPMPGQPSAEMASPFGITKEDHSTWSAAHNTMKRILMGPDGDEQMFESICTLSLALFVTMWSSIFQAAFYAYVNSSTDWDIEQILYFTRLFCDLFGRPLTFLPRPAWFQTGKGLLQASLLRAALMCIFFAYAFIPNFPQSDIFIIGFVGVFSIFSGYLAVLIYEYAASELYSTAQRAHATNILNMSFQIAAFTSVVLSVLITSDYS